MKAQIAKIHRAGLVIALLILAACTGQRGQRPEDIPTLAAFDTLATAQVLTQNAPPPGFREAVSFPEVDAGLSQLAGGHYVVQLEFDGVFSQTPRETTAQTSAEFWFNQVGSSRRVTVKTTGELIGRPDDAFEAVRLGPNSFLVRNNECVKGGSDAEAATSARAGTLLGGVKSATPTGQRATLNGQDTWQYSFTSDNLNLPSIRLADGGSITMTGGELWIAPKNSVVVRFYVNLDVENAIIFDRQLPVSGQVILRYDLYDVGQTTNITVPFGC